MVLLLAGRGQVEFFYWSTKIGKSSSEGSRRRGRQQLSEPLRLCRRCFEPRSSLRDIVGIVRRVERREENDQTAEWVSE